jgi:hypothetical protein
VVELVERERLRSLVAGETELLVGVVKVLVRFPQPAASMLSNNGIVIKAFPILYFIPFFLC